MSLTRLARRRPFQCRMEILGEFWPESGRPQPVAASFSPNGMMQEYELEVFFEGEPDRETGMIVNLARIDELLNQVLTPFENKNLSELPMFSGKTPTPERLVGHLAEELIEAKHKQKDFTNVRVTKARLYVSPDFWVDVWP